MNQTIEVAAVLLAAGASTRVGRPKALLEYQGETFLDRLIRVYTEAGAAPYVVLGYDASAIAAGLRRTGEATFLLNPRPERGQLSSLQIGLAATPESSGFVFFTPVDACGIELATLRRLFDAARHARPPMLVPRHAGRHGHPVGIDCAIRQELLTLDSSGTARDVIHRHQERTLYVDVDDASVLWDIDTLEDWEAIRYRR